MSPHTHKFRYIQNKVKKIFMIMEQKAITFKTDTSGLKLGIGLSRPYLKEYRKKTWHVQYTWQRVQMSTSEVYLIFNTAEKQGPTICSKDFPMDNKHEKLLINLYEWELKPQMKTSAYLPVWLKLVIPRVSEAIEQWELSLNTAGHHPPNFISHNAALWPSGFITKYIPMNILTRKHWILNVHTSAIYSVAQNRI